MKLEVCSWAVGVGVGLGRVRGSVAGRECSEGRIGLVEELGQCEGYRYRVMEMGRRYSNIQ